MHIFKLNDIAIEPKLIESVGRAQSRRNLGENYAQIIMILSLYFAYPAESGYYDCLGA